MLQKTDIKNSFSKSRVHVAYSFWVICRNISRTIVELCIWRRHIWVQFWYTNMAAGNQQKHLEFTRELAYVRKHIF